MSKQNPLSEANTAFADIPDSQYKAAMEVADRYLSFTTELLRLALLGIAAFGFLYKEVFHDFDDSHHDAVTIQAVRSLAAWGVLMFGVSAFFALLFRYWAAEAFRLYIDGLRFAVSNEAEKAKLKLKGHDYVMIVCIVAKAGAALTLGAGAVLTSLAFFLLLA